MQHYDFLVIGGGIAGLRFALEAAEHGTVAVLFKRGFEDCNTAWAQGGIAAVAAQNDSPEAHIKDTEIAGAGLCHYDAVEVVVREGPQRVAELIEYGARFDRLRTGNGYDLAQEGGHSQRRIYRSADATGREILRALLERVRNHRNVITFIGVHAIDLITTVKLGINKTGPNTVLGAYVLMSNGQIEPFVAGKTLVATGGAGKIYLYTSNPDVATGDGIAMCFRAGALVANLEFFQFHPTCLFHPAAKSFLISEAMRGEGAKLRRQNGEEFIHRYHELKELAPRDIVARAIDNEMKTHGEDYVLLDISHRPRDFILAHFPNIYETCNRYGFDITRAPIPVVPAAHYCCGGVVADAYGRSNLRNLYVAGEVAHSGLHGANRLASNSLLEGLVYGYRAAQHATAERSSIPNSATIPAWDAGSAVDSDEQVVVSQTWEEIRRLMWNYVGIVRTNKRLARALRRSDLILKEVHEYYWNFTVTPDLLELRNLSLVANLVIRSAMMRKESRGLHYTIDYPKSDDAYLRDTVIRPDEILPLYE